ncbi:MAG TPA: hypothetical protein VNZ64_17025 [Candidatus Acidoferrum sp.]|nr:hypothetical protein [Candidatus Acidoferrum sp.]
MSVHQENWDLGKIEAATWTEDSGPSMVWGASGSSYDSPARYKAAAVLCWLDGRTSRRIHSTQTHGLRADNLTCQCQNQFKFTFWFFYTAAICDDLGLPNFKTLGRYA